MFASLCIRAVLYWHRPPLLRPRNQREGEPKKKEPPQCLCQCLRSHREIEKHSVFTTHQPPPPNFNVGVVELVVSVICGGQRARLAEDLLASSNVEIGVRGRERTSVSSKYIDLRGSGRQGPDAWHVRVCCPIRRRSVTVALGAFPDYLSHPWTAIRRVSPTK